MINNLYIIGNRKKKFKIKPGLIKDNSLVIAMGDTFCINLPFNINISTFNQYRRDSGLTLSGILNAAKDIIAKFRNADLKFEYKNNIIDAFKLISSLICVDFLIPLLEDVTTFDYILKQTKCNNVHILNLELKTASIMKQICELNRIECVLESNNQNSSIYIESYQFHFNFIKRLIKHTMRKAFFLASAHKNKAKNDILILCANCKRHSLDIIEVIKDILKQGRVNVLVLNDMLSDSSELLKKEKIKFSELERYYTPEISLDSFVLRQNIRKALRKIFTSEEYDYLFEYKSISIKDFLKKSLSTIISGPLETIIIKYFLLNKVLKEARPKIFICVNDTKYASLAAQNNKVHTISVEGSHISDLILEGEGLISNEIIVWSNSDREFLESFGYTKKNIKISGRPSYSRMVKSLQAQDYTKIRVLIKDRYNINSQDKIITFISTDINEKCGFGRKVISETLTYLYEHLSKLDNVFLIIKQHPFEKHGSLHKEILNKFGIMKYILVRNCDINELLLGSDLVVDMGSSASFPVYVIGKPLISIKCDNYFDILSNGYFQNSDDIRCELFSPDLLPRLKDFLADRKDGLSWQKSEEILLHENSIAKTRDFILEPFNV